MKKHWSLALLAAAATIVPLADGFSPSQNAQAGDIVITPIPNPSRIVIVGGRVCSMQMFLTITHPGILPEGVEYQPVINGIVRITPLDMLPTPVRTPARIHVGLRSGEEVRRAVALPAPSPMNLPGSFDYAFNVDAFGQDFPVVATLAWREGRRVRHTLLRNVPIQVVATP